MKSKVRNSADYDREMNYWFDKIMDETANLSAAKTYFAGVGKILAKTKIDIEVTRRMGRDYFDRTKEFVKEHS